MRRSAFLLFLVFLGLCSVVRAQVGVTVSETPSTADEWDEWEDWEDWEDYDELEEEYYGEDGYLLGSEAPAPAPAAEEAASPSPSAPAPSPSPAAPAPAPASPLPSPVASPAPPPSPEEVTPESASPSPSFTIPAPPGMPSAFPVDWWVYPAMSTIISDQNQVMQYAGKADADAFCVSRGWLVAGSYAELPYLGVIWAPGTLTLNGTTALTGSQASGYLYITCLSAEDQDPTVSWTTGANVGYGNTGSNNIGNYNSGDGNVGNGNVGNYNIGDDFGKGDDGQVGIGH